jgi:hypothetical protein
MQQDQNRPYAPGDIVNDHILSSEGHWMPLSPAPPVPPVPWGSPAHALEPSWASVEAEVDRRMASAKTNAWLLWFFLGAFNAHLAYIYPRQRVWIMVGSIGLWIFTLGLSGLFWLVSWAFLIGDHAFDDLRAHKRAQVQGELALRALVPGGWGR